MAALTPLDPRVIPLDRAIGGILAAVVSAGSFVALVLTLLVADAWPWWVGILLFAAWFAGSIVFALWLQIWPAIEYRHASYGVDEVGLEIRRGVWWRHVIHVPRTRVQHTDVSQGPLERHWGLGTLVVFTAGTDHARVELRGLAHEVAVTLRDQLLPGRESDAV
ncbi:MAG: PH domain-containing protein [Acidobacteriota bacterium]